MIVDSLARASRYETFLPGLKAGFDFLARTDLARLENGRHEINDTQAFALVAREQGRGKENSLLEAHRKYLDIQYIIEGEDLIGWLPTASCRRVSSPYDAERDLEFFYDRPDTWLVLPAGMWAIFMPEDAHAPLATQSPVHKVIVKIAVD